MKCSPRLLFFAAAIAWPLFRGGPNCAAQNASVEKNPSARFPATVKRAQPLVELPPDVPVREGEVALWADFAHADAEGVPLYLVNRTNTAQSFSSQDNDIYIELEYRDGAGAWHRAQAHLASDCGNSYQQFVLLPRQFLTLRGYRSSTGSKHAVRYATQIGERLTSNEGKGLISEADLQAVALDSLTAREIPFHIRSLIACWDNMPLPADPALPERTEGIRMLAWLPSNPPAFEDLHRLQGKIEALAPSAARDTALQAIRETLAKGDAPKLAPEALARRCIDRIAHRPTADPAMSEYMAWCLLADPRYGREPIVPSTAMRQPERWSEVIAPAVALLQRNERGKHAQVAAAILKTGWIVDALVPDEELEAWVLSSSETLSLIGARTFARRARYPRLVALGWKVPAEKQIMLLHVPAFPNEDGRSAHETRSPRDAEESRFWEHCMRSMPVEAANALWSYDFQSGYNPFDRQIHDLLRSFFRTEAERGIFDHDLGAQASGLPVALELLASWRVKEDDALLAALLKHGGFQRSETWSSESAKHYWTQYFPLRRVAKNALVARGQPPAEDVVTNVEIPIPDSKQAP
ncbi:MAG: hypothetical protein ABJF10_10835 [Chthoniobacter sp.]|uniref:hypothetical protein n=1 Tax=Chthoniobacter sp. TaxID=2510640 RepID=UPI0032AE59A9